MLLFEKLLWNIFSGNDYTQKQEEGVPRRTTAMVVELKGLEYLQGFNPIIYGIQRVREGAFWITRKNECRKVMNSGKADR